MSEKTSGIYRLVTNPKFYSVFQDILGGKKARESFRYKYFDDLQGKSVLEVGCGPGTWFPQIEDCAEYLGMDWNQDHIDAGNKQYGSSTVRFVCGDVSKDVNPDQRKFDYIFAFGILHHLSDQQAIDLITVCSALLKKQGRFISIDPVYHENQHFFAKWMNDRDSGQNIRSEEGYRKLSESLFTSIGTTVCTDKLRVPYSHCVMVAEQS